MPKRNTYSQLFFETPPTPKTAKTDYISVLLKNYLNSAHLLY